MMLKDKVAVIYGAGGDVGDYGFGDKLECGNPLMCPPGGFKY